MPSGRARKHVCRLCGKDYSNPDDLTAHMISQHDHPELVCSEVGCNKSFKAPRALKRHVKERHEGLVFSCSNCNNFSCSRRENLKRHKKSCSKKHGQDGHADNTSVVSASVPSLPAAGTVAPAFDNSPVISDLGSDATSTSMSSSFSLPAISDLPIDLTNLWSRLWNLAVSRAAANVAAQYPIDAYQRMLPWEERVQMQVLILEENDQGRLCDEVACRWSSHVDSLEAWNIGLSELCPEACVRALDSLFFLDRSHLTNEFS